MEIGGVADIWFDDGFDLSDLTDKVRENIKSMLPMAYDHEMVVDVKVVKEPSKETEAV